MDAGTSLPARASRGIQSVEVGGQLLLALAHRGTPMALKDLARTAGMSPAKAHPYLVSFCKLGLIEQDGGNGRYGLGPLALQLGLISLQLHDPVRLATPVIDELAQQLGLTVAISVWGSRGATVVQVAEAPAPVLVKMRHGTVMSLTGTASGRLFAAHLPRPQVLAALSADGGPPIDAAFEAVLAEVRERRLASVADSYVRGIGAIAAPVFDGQGAIVLGLTAIGPTEVLEMAADSRSALLLQRAATSLSRRLGWRGPADAAPVAAAAAA